MDVGWQNTLRNQKGRIMNDIVELIVLPLLSVVFGFAVGSFGLF